MRLHLPLYVVVWLSLAAFVSGQAQTVLVTDTALRSMDQVNRNLVLKLVNDVRSKGCYCGKEWMPPVAPLVWHEALEQAGFTHSSNMAAREFFSHVNPESGSEPGDRIRETGYQATAWGENIFYGTLREQMAIEGWLNSSGHCKNIMSPYFREMGVSRKGLYWTQVFGSRFR